MKVKLPIVVKNEIENGKRIFETAEQEFELDPSLADQMRWEAKFPELACKESLVDYSLRVRKIKDKSAATVLSKMKAVYCLFDTDLTFIQFVKLFDISVMDYVNELVARLNEIFEIVLNSSVEKNS